MIRSVIALFVFAVALCAYIVTRPTNNVVTAVEINDLAAVSRAQTETLLPQSTQSDSTTVRPLNLVPNTLSRSVDIIAVGLGIMPAPTEGPLVAQSHAVLAEISQVSRARPTFEGHIVLALKDSTPDQDIYRDINQFARDQGFKVPASLLNTEGDIDTDVLLDIIVNRAQTAAGNATTEQFSPAPGSITLSDADGKFYRVGEGDSLARIAKMFYGDPSLHFDIWAANLDVLSSGYQVTTGQKLYIP